MFCSPILIDKDVVFNIFELKVVKIAAETKVENQ